MKKIALILVLVLASEVVGFGLAHAEDESSVQSELENIPAISEEVQSLGEIATENEIQAETQNEDEKDFKDIVKQTTDYTCGPAALATLINLTGGSVSEMQLASLSNTTPEKGTTMLGLKNAAKALGYEVSMKSVSLSSFKKQKFPILFHENNKEDGEHYAVARGLGDDTIKVADPSAGNIEVKIEDFKESFDGKILAISLPKEVKSGQSADVALQILEEKGATVVDLNGNEIDIDELQQDLSDEDASNTNGKFAQVLLIPIAEVGQLLIVGGIVIGFTWYFSKVEKILDGSYRALDTHVNKMKDPCNIYTSSIKKTIKNVIEVIDKKLPKAPNAFRKSFEKKYKPLREKALKAINKNKC